MLSRHAVRLENLHWLRAFFISGPPTKLAQYLAASAGAGAAKKEAQGSGYYFGAEHDFLQVRQLRLRPANNRYARQFRYSWLHELTIVSKLNLAS